MMTDPTMAMQSDPNADMTDRRRALARMLMTPNVPMEAYRTPQGTAMGGGQQLIQSLGSNPQFMKWLQGAFTPTAGAAGAIPMAANGMAAGPV